MTRVLLVFVLLIASFTTACGGGYARRGTVRYGSPQPTVYVQPTYGRRGTVVVAPQRDRVYVAPPRASGRVYVTPPSRGTVVVTPPSRGRVVVTPPR